MSAAFHLAYRYLRQHPFQTLLLASVLGLLLALPFALRLLLHRIEDELHHRAVATPLVLGARASALDLVLSSLHYRRPPPPPLLMSDVSELMGTGRAMVIPLHVRFHAQQAPIVGTQLEYFRARRLHLACGSLFHRLGDCVIGSRIARARDLQPGDSVISSPEQAFDLDGVYPLKMRVTGVLAASGTPDDDAVFVDIKTAWLIEGRAHGHDDLMQAPDELVLERSPERVVANAAVRLYNEVTEQNLASFHFHGDPASYPVTCALVFPHDAKADALLSGRYQSGPDAQRLQLIVPLDWLRSLMDTLFRLERLLLLVFAVTGLGGLATTALVFALSHRLRRREFQTLADLGIPKRSLRLVKLTEGLLVAALALSLTVVILVLIQYGAPALVRFTLQ